jgi:hypothetical protein
MENLDVMDASSVGKSPWRRGIYERHAGRESLTLRIYHGLKRALAAVYLEA